MLRVPLYVNPRECIFLHHPSSNDSSSPHRPSVRLLARNRCDATAAPPIDDVPSSWLRNISTELGNDMQLKAPYFSIDENQTACGQFAFGVEPLERRHLSQNPIQHSSAQLAEHFFQLASYFAGLEKLPDQPAEPASPPLETHSDKFEAIIALLLKKFPSQGDAPPIRRRCCQCQHRSTMLRTLQRFEGKC